MKCVRRMVKSIPAKKSWRRQNVRGGFLLFACAKRNWSRGRCKGGIKLWEKVNVQKGGRCRAGYKRYVKRS